MAKKKPAKRKTVAKKKAKKPARKIAKKAKKTARKPAGKTRRKSAAKPVRKAAAPKKPAPVLQQPTDQPSAERHVGAALSSFAGGFAGGMASTSLGNPFAASGDGEPLNEDNDSSEEE
ncbi:MAG: hypothetical protein A2583_14540 [Bdellovibrionales bacterium RIFOXYD1_FULL_53_11]|nr:MAG: hypothetical protein A2583_14540 [Bdellovibrionales bacterium RIFOXYD1_FULL_53_11]